MAQSATDSSQLESAIADLQIGSRALVNWPIDKRRSVAEACVRSVAQSAREWVEAACAAKRIPAGSNARAEEITGGPLATVRQLQLLVSAYHDIAQHGEPMLPGRVSFDHGQLRTQIFPTRQLFDSLLFGPIKAETWLQPNVRKDDLFDPAINGMNAPGTAPPQIACVLGAGNVSSIPATDTLTKVFQESKAVLLKVNPVNEYIGGIFEKALSPLIDASVLRVIYGGADIGNHAIQHADVDEVHITGSTNTHDAIVWGVTDAERDQNRAANTPVLIKRITSELGKRHALDRRARRILGSPTSISSSKHCGVDHEQRFV